MDNPIKYAKNDDVHIAYRVFGDGPRDLVLIITRPKMSSPTRSRNLLQASAIALSPTGCSPP